MVDEDFLELTLGFTKPWYIVGVDQSDDVVEIKLDYPVATKFQSPACGKFLISRKV
jgi:hypothetical protein